VDAGAQVMPSGWAFFRAGVLVVVAYLVIVVTFSIVWMWLHPYGLRGPKFETPDPAHTRQVLCWHPGTLSGWCWTDKGEVAF
jgi:hypothetical protein